MIESEYHEDMDTETGTGFEDEFREKFKWHRQSSLQNGGRFNVPSMSEHGPIFNMNDHQPLPTETTPNGNLIQT